MRLLVQMEAYAACDDPDVREAMRSGYGKLHLFVETVSGVDDEAVANWFAHGMLLNVVAAMDLWSAREPGRAGSSRGRSTPSVSPPRRVARRSREPFHFDPYVSE